MAVGNTNVKLTEKGKAAALTIKEYNKRLQASSDSEEAVEEPWYACYMDSHRDAMLTVAKEVHNK